MFWRILLVSASIALWGCGSASGSALKSYKDAPLQSEEDAYAWTSSSAPNVYFIGTVFLLEFQLINLGPFPGGGGDRDPNCPKITKNDNKTTVEGGCTDNKGVRWIGKLTDKRDAAGSRTGKTTFDGFGSERQVTCNGQSISALSTTDGTIGMSGSDSDLKFDLDLLVEGKGPNDGNCAVEQESFAVDYTGRFIQSGTSKTTWSGSGRLGSSRFGKASAETRDEVIDTTVCEGNEAASGTTTVKSGSNTIVYTYDGATKCDDIPSVQWSLDGTAMGELQNVSCAAGGPVLAGWGLFTLLGAAMLRRRRR
jgi:hypothetical protein